MTNPSRKSHQLQVAALLDEVDQRRRRLYSFAAAGATSAALRDEWRELKSVRAELAAAVSH